MKAQARGARRHQDQGERLKRKENEYERMKKTEASAGSKAAEATGTQETLSSTAHSGGNWPTRRSSWQGQGCKRSLPADSRRSRGQARPRVAKAGKRRRRKAARRSATHRSAEPVPEDQGHQLRNARATPTAAIESWRDLQRSGATGTRQGSENRCRYWPAICTRSRGLRRTFWKHGTKTTARKPCAPGSR